MRHWPLQMLFALWQNHWLPNQYFWKIQPIKHQLGLPHRPTLPMRFGALKLYQWPGHWPRPLWPIARQIPLMPWSSHKDQQPTKPLANILLIL